MASRRLRRRAQAQAQAAVQPARAAQRGQIKATRQDTNQTVKSIGSLNRGVQGAIGSARKDFRHIPGLTGGDQRIALEQLANLGASTASGIAFMKADARQTGQQSIQQLRQTMPQADVASALQALISQRQSNKQDVKMAKLTSRLDTKSAIAQAAAEAKLQPKSGLTKNEQRGVHVNRQNALSLVRAAYHHSQAGSKGAPPVPQTQGQWREWADKLYGAYHTTVDRGDINWAIKQIRQHQQRHNRGTVEHNFTPGLTGSAGIG